VTFLPSVESSARQETNTAGVKWENCGIGLTKGIVKMFGRIDIDPRELDTLSCEAEIEDLDENDLALLKDEDEDEDFDDEDFDDDEDDEEEEEEEEEEEDDEDEEYADAEDEIWAELCQECPDMLNDLIGRDYEDD